MCEQFLYIPRYHSHAKIMFATVWLFHVANAALHHEMEAQEQGYANMP